MLCDMFYTLYVFYDAPIRVAL